MSLPGSVLGWVDGQFHDNDGNPLSDGEVTFYIANTTTPKNTYTTAQRTTPNTNPVVLDSAGRAHIYVEPGGYDILIHDADGNLLRTVTDYEDVGLTFLAGLGNTIAEGSKDVADGYVVLATDQLVTTDSGATGTPDMTLPAASARTTDSNGNGMPLWIKNFSAVAWTIVPNGSDTIDGLADYELAAAVSPLFPAVMLVSDGVSAWYVVGGLGV